CSRKIASGSPAYNRTILFEGDAIIKPEPREGRPLCGNALWHRFDCRGDCRTQGGQAWLWRYCSLTYRDFIGIKEKRFLLALGTKTPGHDKFVGLLALRVN